MKTTKLDFAQFQQYCDKYFKILGLTEWSVFYNHEKLEDAYAKTAWNLAGGACTISFSTYWDDLRPKTEKEIERLALHETLHVLMAPILSEATSRYTTEDSVFTAEHLIIRRLEKLV